MTNTHSLIRAAAQVAAQMQMTRSDANPYEVGSELWHQFNEALRTAESELHEARREQEVAA